MSFTVCTPILDPRPYTLHPPRCLLQGMNFIAGAFMLFMGEEDAFWAVTVVVEDLLPGYFALDLVAAQVDQLVFKHMVSQRDARGDCHYTAGPRV